MQILVSQVLGKRKVVGEAKLTDKGGVTYEEFTQEFGGVTYVFRPEHVTIDEVSKFGNPRCNVCFGQGRKTVEIAKTRLKGPGDHVLLSRGPFEGSTQLEKERLIELERKSKTWRVLLPCECAVKAMSKRDPNFFVSDDRAIMFRVVYEEKAKAG